jgi:hypothetical protein
MNDQIAPFHGPSERRLKRRCDHRCALCSEYRPSIKMHGSPSNSNGVSGESRVVPGVHPPLSAPSRAAIDQRRFTDVGTANDGDAQRFSFSPFPRQLHRSDSAK